MTRIPVVTQNFSSPDVLTDSPLMLLPQPPVLNTLIDRDQEGFSQLLLHDLHRHRQSYVRSYTAFETLKKRQDFVLRQENLRALQNLEQRVINKQEQSIDQSLHSYEQCFVKVINPNQSSSTGSHHHPYPDPLKATKNNATYFDKHHIYPLSHTPAMPLDPPAITPFHRYQKSHRPRVTAKYRAQSAIQRTALCLHDAFQSSNHLHQTPPFVSFTESYLQKYAERSSARFTINSNLEKSEDEVPNLIDQEDLLQQRSTHSMDVRGTTQPQRSSDLHKSKSSDAQRVRATVTSRNTNTPSTTPQMHYQDAVRDGLNYAQNHPNERRSSLTEQRRLSQQSSEKSSFTFNQSNVNGRPKTAKKKSSTRAEPLTPTRNDVVTGVSQENDILRQSMFVQNYGNNVPDSLMSTKTERSSVTSTVRASPLKKTNGTVSHTPSPMSDLNPDVKSPVTMSVSQTLSPEEKLTEPSRNSPLPDIKQTETPTPVSQPEVVVENLNPTEPIITNPVESKPELIDPRKRIRNSLVDQNESIKDLMSFELDLGIRSRGTMKKTRFDLNGKGSTKLDADDGTVTVKDNQGTLDLLEKIRSGVVPVTIGQHPLSQRNCRFELPFDLKILETLTPLQYLSKYCRLSSRRTYQFKRIFDKYRNNQYRFESTDLFRSILDVHSDNFTRTHYDQLCELLDLGHEQHQFAFDTFSGILALCERVLCDSEEYRRGVDEYDLGKDTIEKCDFDSLDRKLDGLNVNDTMKKLLRAL